MQITEVTASYGLTQSLPEYSNVKPMVTLKATISDEEDPADIKRHLFETARAWVEEEADAALERAGLAAKYSQEPRFQLIATRRERPWKAGPDWTPLENVVAIIPNGIPVPDDWIRIFNSEGLRYQHAFLVAQRERAKRDATRIIVCRLASDLAELPTRPLAPIAEPAQADDVLALAREAKDYGDYEDDEEEGEEGEEREYHDGGF